MKGKIFFSISQSSRLYPSLLDIQCKQKTEKGERGPQGSVMLMHMVHVSVYVFGGNSRGRQERFQNSLLALCHAWLLGLFVWNNGHTGNTWTHWQMISGSQTSFPEVISHFLSLKHTRTQPSALRKPQKTLRVAHIQILVRPAMVFLPHVTAEISTESKLTYFTFIIHVLGREWLIGEAYSEEICLDNLWSVFWILKITLARLWIVSPLCYYPPCCFVQLLVFLLTLTIQGFFF